MMRQHAEQVDRLRTQNQELGQTVEEQTHLLSSTLEVSVGSAKKQAWSPSNSISFPAFMSNNRLARNSPDQDVRPWRLSDRGGTTKELAIRSETQATWRQDSTFYLETVRMPEKWDW